MLYAYHLNGDITLGMHEYLMIILRKHVRTGMAEPRGKGAHVTYPQDYGRSEKWMNSSSEKSFISLD